MPYKPRVVGRSILNVLLLKKAQFSQMILKECFRPFFP